MILPGINPAPRGFSAPYEIHNKQGALQNKGPKHPFVCTVEGDVEDGWADRAGNRQNARESPCFVDGCSGALIVVPATSRPKSETAS